MQDCHFISADIGWVAGEDGDVLHTANGGIPVGISETGFLQNEVRIYPNPAHYEVNIEAKINLTNAQLIIFNSLGETIKRIININGEQMTIGCQEFSNGLYFALLKNNNKEMTAKFIINKK